MLNYKENLNEKIKKYVKDKELNYNQILVSEKLNLYNIEIYKSTVFRTLFKISEYLNVDIRNLLVFEDKTYTFENSFENFEEFYSYVGKLFKKIRLEKSITAKELVNKIDDNVGVNYVYNFENNKKTVSLKKFYKFLEGLEITADEFFLWDNSENKEDVSNMLDYNQNIRRKLDKYIKNSGLSYAHFQKINGVKNINDSIYAKLINFKVLFEFSQCLNIDVRNFFISKSETHIFKNSFKDFEEFYSYTGNLFKRSREEKTITVKEIINKMDSKINIAIIYNFEGGKSKIAISLERFYKFLDAINMSIDEFFLNEENR